MMIMCQNKEQDEFNPFDLDVPGNILEKRASVLFRENIWKKPWQELSVTRGDCGPEL